MSSTKRVRGVSVFRPIIYGNTAVLLEGEEKETTDHTHRWTIGVRSANSPPLPAKKPADQIGGGDDLSYFIKKVTFKLHETYPQPLRTIEKPPFEVTETGWGEFDIAIKIFFVPEASEKPISFTHHLKLHPWPLDPALVPVPLPDGSIPEPAPDAPKLVLSPIHSWQYDEIVFSEPTEQFYSILLEHTPTGLPKMNRHPRELTHALGGGGNIGEFSQEMEVAEGARLDEARKKTLELNEEMRVKLKAHEETLQALKAEVDQLQGEANAAAAAAATAA